jgi:hypothetical protein
VADLAQAPADAGLLLDDGLGLLGRAGRMLGEVFRERYLMLSQGAPGLMPLAAVETRQAALTVLIEVALDRASGDIGVGGDVVVVQSVALEPEDLDLALDAGIGVMIAIVGKGSAVFGCSSAVK